MQPDLIFIHSAGSQSDGGGSSKLLSRLKVGLEPLFKFHSPAMPSPENPNCKEWEEALSRIFGAAGSDLVVIGHSLGGSVLLKYLSERDAVPRIRGLYVLAAPYWGADENWDVDEFKFQDPDSVEIESVDHLRIYHGKDDGIVPVSHLDRYAHKYPQASVRSLPNAGHLFAEGADTVIHDILSVVREKG